MNKLKAVIKNELIRYFVSPLAYVYLLSFLILNGAFAVYFGDFFNRGQADLHSMFMFQPWLYLLFIPGISMRLWAEEFRNKTIMQIATMPVSVTTLVWGKFFASWIFCGLALILTFPFWLTVNSLGSPDNKVILLGYFSSFMLTGCMLAISQALSALTKNQVIALVLAVIVNLLFFWSGIEFVLAFLRPILPDTIIDTIASFSFLTHFDTMSMGLLELRDIIFFSSVILLGNYTTILIVNYKTSGNSGWLKSTGKFYDICAWIMLLIGFLGINILANNYTADIQYDATEEKNFTLTATTHDVLAGLKEPVTAKLYFSPILGQRNPELREKFDNIRMLLRKYKSASDGKFNFKVYYPAFLSEEEDIALADGVQPIPLIDLNQNALFGLTVEDTLQNKETIPFFAQNENGALEQDITAKIHYLGNVKKNLGIISGLPIFGATDEDAMFLGQPWEIVNLLEKDYRIHHIMSADDFKNRKFDVLILFAPYHLSPDMIDKIKEYSRNRGKIIAVLDPAAEASRLYSGSNGYLNSFSDTELEEFWGFKFYSEYVVADLKNSITVDSTIDYNKNPIFSQDVIQFRLSADDMNPAHPTTKNLQEIMMASASVIMPDSEKYHSGEITFYPLLRASGMSALMTAKVVQDGLNPQQILKYFQPDDNAKFMAAEIIGMTKDNPFDLIVIGDTDFLYDSFWMNKKYLLESEYVDNVFDNANFFLNAVDYLADNQSLIGLRGKRARLRRFEGIEILRRINSMQYKQQEEAIFEEIEKTKLALQKVWNKRRFEEREQFNQDELTVISQIRSNLIRLRQQLGNLREQTFNNLAVISRNIALFNIWLVPAIFAICCFIAMVLSKLKKRRKTSWCCHLNRRFFILSGICLLIFAISMFSVYLVNYSAIDSYENKKVFPEIAANLNKIDKIALETHSLKRTFIYNDGIWKLEEMPDLPVYQERIRHLLTISADALYFAKKSNLAQNLQLFNLQPLEDSSSKAMHISFIAGDKTISAFNLGDINIDIGRGAKAAYIRFDDQFQVWEINADFIDMDPDWHKWTYSNLWDLRFGRLYDRHNNPQKEQILANLVKLMINTPIIRVADKPLIQPLKTVKLYIENGNYADISFYQVDGTAYAAFDFDENNQNPHLKLWASYLKDKALVIETEKMEHILELL